MDPPAMSLTLLEERLKYRFKNRRLLEVALTHRSVPGADCYEKLEFVGDSIIARWVSHFLLHENPKRREGVLTKIRSKLTSNRHLAEVAQRLGIPALIRYGESIDGERAQRDEKVPADVLEAIFGAVAQDGGEDQAKELVFRIFFADVAGRGFRSEGYPGVQTNFRQTKSTNNLRDIIDRMGRR